MRGLVSVLLIVGALLVWGFVRGGATAPRPRPLSGEHDPMTTRLSDEGSPGERIYLRYCSGCHGVEGDGKGPAAPFLAPKPRDFTKGIYKFVSTPGGSLPLDEDLHRTIIYGLHGTSMPGWRFLSLLERQQLIDHLKTFFDWEEGYPAPAVPFYENPFDVTDAADIAKAAELGKEVYHKDATCWSCHPAYMPREELEQLLGRQARPDLEETLAKPDAWGESILPPDFPKTRLKSVRTLQDLYRAITAGIGGTAMPTWKDTLSAEQLWALTIYVDSIRRGSKTRSVIEGER